MEKSIAELKDELFGVSVRLNNIAEDIMIKNTQGEVLLKRKISLLKELEQKEKQERDRNG